MASRNNEDPLVHQLGTVFDDLGEAVVEERVFVPIANHFVFPFLLFRAFPLGVGDNPLVDALGELYRVFEDGSAFERFVQRVSLHPHPMGDIGAVSAVAILDGSAVEIRIVAVKADIDHVLFSQSLGLDLELGVVRVFSSDAVDLDKSEVVVFEDCLFHFAFS